MSVRSFQRRVPQIDPSAWVDPAAVVIGEVTIGADASLWPMAVARGDVAAIHIGARSNVQDGAVLHVTADSAFAPGGAPCRIGDDVTIGHGAVVHGCSVGDHCLIGMGAVVLDGAVLEPWVMLAAGSVVPPGKHLDGDSLWLGNPVRRVRALRDSEREYIAYAAAHYVELKDQVRLEA